jgi:hypothetical protein
MKSVAFTSKQLYRLPNGLTLAAGKPGAVGLGPGALGPAPASSDSHARLCSGESAICGMPRVKVDAMRGEYFPFGAK